jgi:hypothetical protein
MRFRNFFGMVGAAAIAFGFTACGSDSTGPEDVSAAQERLDIAVSVGDAVAEDVALMAAGEASMSSLGTRRAAAMPVGVNASWSFPSNCEFNSLTERFTCLDVSNDGLTLSRSYQLFDADGTPQAAYDANTTASANFMSVLSGNISRGRWTADILRERNATVTGLDDDERRTWNGSGIGSVEASYDDGDVSRTYNMMWSTTVSDVVVAIPRNLNPWPLSGTVYFSVNATRTREGMRSVNHTVALTARVVFNGTNRVRLVVGDDEYTLDLFTRTVEEE